MEMNGDMPRKEPELRREGNEIILQKLEPLLELPGTREAQMYLGRRLFTLSTREQYLLAAACTLRPPRTVSDAIHHLFAQENYTVCLSENDEDLGRAYLRQMSPTPQDVLPHVDLASLGQLYRIKYPGLFIEGCYAAYSPQPKRIIPQDSRYHRYWDGGWCIRLKLASAAVPKGVWLRLPDTAPDSGCAVGEITLACRKLKTDCLDTCTLLDFESVLPVGNLKEQYSSIDELVKDGNTLGNALDKWAHEFPPSLDRLAAALEYENCHTLKTALDVLWNLQCYKWVPVEDREYFAINALRDRGVSKELIMSGAIDLYSCAEDILESSGYVYVKQAGGYVFRDEQKHIQYFDAPADGQDPAQGGMTMQ